MPFFEIYQKIIIFYFQHLFSREILKVAEEEEEEAMARTLEGVEVMVAILVEAE